VFKTWLGERDTSWRDCVEVVVVDGFTGFKSDTSEELLDVVVALSRRVRGHRSLGHAITDIVAGAIARHRDVP